MAGKKVIAICQSGGEFVANRDGSLSYNGGEAYVVDVDEGTPLTDFKSEVADMFNFNADRMTIKYFLPGNKKTLITISKDKDLQRMVSFLADSATIDVFIISEDSAALTTTTTPLPIAKSNRTNDIATVEVAIQMADHLDVDMPVQTPISCTVLDPNDDRHRKAAQQWDNLITGVDQRFSNLNEFREALHKFSIARGFAYKYKKNDSHRVSVKCKTPGCPWRIYASKLSTTQMVCIKKMVSEHTCDGAVAKAGYRASRSWVGSIIREKLKLSPNYRPKDIVEDIKREYGIEMNYSQARRAKEFVREQLQGSCKTAYSLLPFFCDKIKETNPGSISTYATKEDSSFHRLFVAFHASLSGFQQGCRPLIFLDSTLFNSKYQGVLMAAVAADAEDGTFPIAYAVADVESEDNWRWFLHELKSALPSSGFNQITFVADSENGLKGALADVFDKCYHSYCVRRLADKLNRDVKGQLSHEARRFMMSDFCAAASALKLDDYERALANIKAISPDAYDWVLKSEPEHWANVFFGGERYSHMTASFGQDFYHWVSDANELPITQIIDILRGKMMDSLYRRRVESSGWTTKLTPSNEEKLQQEIAVAHSLQVLLAEGSTYQVIAAEETVDVVDIDHCDCSCKRWRLTGLPCCHAIAVLECTGRSAYDYCSRYFTVESYRLTYAESIYPVPNVDRSLLGELGEAAITITPPPTKRPPGRSKAKQRQNEVIDMNKRQLQCSKCKGLGHNKKTCKDP